ncbi:TfoX/Sxy family protein [Sinanaerobacter chloroacetimidivorans]|uniref:TfoX/Sxy family protein n=1 Tax=Sinanaerobacter chloroacetimidivorans TaxID=2818044 RepID=A0A8J7W2L9_9FIRM|nr:TfoX/Sxy family protein [Sinanaerobacter chloroacetimidivorans]MBR0599757.1 TfoX/Sxy family protein [Sinanaerobacter chloroacetimidivorans]
MGELANLFNIGKEVERQLNEVGITTEDALRQIGSKDAWLRIKKIDDSACIHRLYALEGAIEGIKKSQLSPEKKEELKEFYRIQTAL